VKNRLLSRWAFVGIVSAVLLVISVSATSQTQQRVQSTNQISVTKPEFLSLLIDWEVQYDEAAVAAAELAQSGYPEHAERIKADLEDLDEAVRDYVHATESLRHKSRDYDATMQFLATQNLGQMEARRFQTLSNVSKVAHEVAAGSVRNLKD